MGPVTSACHKAEPHTWATAPFASHLLAGQGHPVLVHHLGVAAGNPEGCAGLFVSDQLAAVSVIARSGPPLDDAGNSPAALGPVALAVHRQDVPVVGAMQQGSDEALRPEYFRPLVEWQIGDHQGGASLVALPKNPESSSEPMREREARTNSSIIVRFRRPSRAGDEDAGYEAIFSTSA